MPDRDLHLVTGATGFVGSALTERLLARGERVRVLARPTTDAGRLVERGAEIHRGDLNDPRSLEAAVEGVSCIHHLGDIGMRVKDAGRKNVAAVAALARAARGQAGFRRFVFLSSLTTVSVPERLPADEETPVDARRLVDDYYTRYKRGCEAALRESGVPASVVRAGTIYGPGAAYLSKFIALCARLRFVPCVGRLDVRLATIHVADLVHVLDAAARYSGDACRTFHAVDDAAGSVREFLARAARAAGVRVRFWDPPLSLQKALGAVLDPLIALRLPGRNLEAMIRYMSFEQRFSNRRIKEELGVALRFPLWDDLTNRR